MQPAWIACVQLHNDLEMQRIYCPALLHLHICPMEWQNLMTTATLHGTEGVVPWSSGDKPEVNINTVNKRTLAAAYM